MVGVDSNVALFCAIFAIHSASCWYYDSIFNCWPGHISHYKNNIITLKTVTDNDVGQPRRVDGGRVERVPGDLEEDHGPRVGGVCGGSWWSGGQPAVLYRSFLLKKYPRG